MNELKLLDTERVDLMSKELLYKEGETIVLSNPSKDLRKYQGLRATITEILPTENTNNYSVLIENGVKTKVRQAEIVPIDEKYKNMELNVDDEKKHGLTGEVIKIVKIDWVNGKAEIKILDSRDGLRDAVIKIEHIVGLKYSNEDDCSERVNNIIEKIRDKKKASKSNKFTKIGTEIGEFTDSKNKQYGSSVDATLEMIKVLMERYRSYEDTYTIPESLLQHILLQVRMMDKQNRIFNNPSGIGDSESPYRDLCGYSLIGIDMVEGK